MDIKKEFKDNQYRVKAKDVSRRYKVDEVNIPAYNDELINKEIKKRENAIKIEKEREKLEKEKMEIKEFKKTLKSFNELNNHLKLSMVLLIPMAITSLLTFSILSFISSVLLLISIYYLGIRIVPKDNKDDTEYIAVNNFKIAIKDFVEYVLGLDLKEDYFKISPKLNIISLIILSIVPSYTGIPIFLFVLLIFNMIYGLAMDDFEDIKLFINKLSICLLIGFILKSLLFTLYLGTFFVDYFNIIMIFILSIFTEYINEQHK